MNLGFNYIENRKTERSFIERTVLTEKKPFKIKILESEFIKENKVWWYWDEIDSVFMVRACISEEMPILTGNHYKCSDVYFDLIKLKSKGIILMHDSSFEEDIRNNSLVFEAVKLLVDKLIENDYKFVNLDSIPQVLRQMEICNVKVNHGSENVATIESN